MLRSDEMTGRRAMKVSVVVPVYNGEKTIRAAVDSLLSQSYGDVEIVVIDDGSRDATGEILAEYGDRIRCIRKENGGVSSARNRGIVEATGEYLMFADADDVCHADMVGRAVACMQRAEADYLIAGFTNVEPERREDSVYGERLFPDKQAIRDGLSWILSNGLNCPYSKLYKTRLIRDNNIRFDESIPLGEDFNFNLEYLLIAERLVYMNESLYDYMIFNSVATTAYREDLYDCRIRSIRKMNDTLARHGMDNPMEADLRVKLLYAEVFNLQKPACPHAFSEKKERVRAAKKRYFTAETRKPNGKYKLLRAAARLCPAAVFYVLCSLLRAAMRLLPESPRGLSV